MKRFAIFMLAILLLLTGCRKQEYVDDKEDKDKTILVTTTMLKDLVDVLVGDRLEVIRLINVGVDPHEYEPSAGDIKKLDQADIIIYSGLHLEGKMIDIFDQLSERNKLVIEATDKIPESYLHDWDDGNYKDPHVWGSVEVWSYVVDYVADCLMENLSDFSEEIDENRIAYQKELADLDQELKDMVETIDENSRYLVTAHDAFQYLADEYGLEVRAIQGVSTVAEANTKDIEKLAKFIVDHNIKSIFVETSVPTKLLRKPLIKPRKFLKRKKLAKKR